MADKHPYMSGSAGLVQTTEHLRKSFPTQVAAETLKKLGIASNNETYVINILRFIKVLDDEGKKTSKASSVFTKHDDEEFQKGFAEMVEAAYSDLFSLHGKQAWELPTDKLISYFRSNDHTSAIVGQRQASTFQALAGLSGHGESPTQKTTAPTRRVEKKAAAKKPALDSHSKCNIQYWLSPRTGLPEEYLMWRFPAQAFSGPMIHLIDGECDLLRGHV